MGYNTTILILNDGLDQIRQNPEEFTEKLYNAIGHHNGDQTFGVGNHMNCVTVMKTEHADVFRLYATEGNSIVELTRWSDTTLRLLNGHDFQRRWVKSLISKAKSSLRELNKLVQEAGTGNERV